MIQITEINDLKKIYKYQTSFCSPCFFSVTFCKWKESFSNDVDGNGRRLFKELYVKAAYEDNELIGFIQYGKTAFGFNNQGEISFDISYNVIRNLYFNKNRSDVGNLLISSAMESFEKSEKVYAFFHYFGMSCFARHGKLFELHSHIEELLNHNGFLIEHENVYYSSILTGDEQSDVEIVSHNLTKGNQQYIDFILFGGQVGGCEVHYIDDKTTYLRWIYVNKDIIGKGIGTRCMNALKIWLYKKGTTRFDTDTSFSNIAAQHFYEKNGFIRKGITRSYYKL